MSVFNKRNAVVGYITLKAVSRKVRRRRKRSGAKIALFVSLGLVSAGVLAGLAFFVLRRQHGESEQAVSEQAVSEQGVGYASRDDESEIVGEYVTTLPEPIPAT